MEWGKELSAAFQIVDERHWYLAMAKLSEGNWTSSGRICRRSKRNMLGSPSSKRKVVGLRGVFWGGGGVGGGGSIWRERERSAWSAKGMGRMERSRMKGSRL